MRILHVVAAVEQGGGIGESVPWLCRHLALRGNAVGLAALSLRPSDAARGAGACGVELAWMRPSAPAALYFSLDFVRRLPSLVAAADVVHVHSNWTFPVWWACHLALARGKPLVMSPRGCLEPERLRRSAAKKRLAGFVFDRRYLRRARVIHATAESEAEAITRYLAEGGAGARAGRAGPQVVVVPNGVNAESFGGASDRGYIGQRWPACKGKRTLLFLSRIHPLKGLPLLIEAWARVPRHGWQLLVIGEDEGGHEGEIRRMAESLGVAQSVTFGGPLYGSEKASVMKASELFVLPSHNENFGIVVAESLACGVPVITTKGTPWAELLGNTGSSEVHKCESSKVRESVTANGADQANADNLRTLELPNSRTSRCGWWVEIGVAPLAAALQEAMSLADEERREMGENGRRLVAEKYQWGRIAERMSAVYSGIVNGKP